MAVNNKNIPVYVYHGTQDPIVVEKLGQDAVAYLQGMGYNPRYTTYPAEHTVTPEQINDIAKVLANILAK